MVILKSKFIGIEYKEKMGAFKCDACDKKIETGQSEYTITVLRWAYNEDEYSKEYRICKECFSQAKIEGDLINFK